MKQWDIVDIADKFQRFKPVPKYWVDAASYAILIGRARFIAQHVLMFSDNPAMLSEAKKFIADTEGYDEHLGQ